MRKLVLSLFILAMVSVGVNAQNNDNYKHQTGKRKTVKESQVITVTEEKDDYKHSFSSEKDSSSKKGLVKTGATKKSYKHQVPLKRN